MLNLTQLNLWLVHSVDCALCSLYLLFMVPNVHGAQCSRCTVFTVPVTAHSAQCSRYIVCRRAMFVPLMQNIS